MACWRDWAKEEMHSPMAAAVMMKSRMAAASSQMEPWKGMRNQNMATSTTKTACMEPVMTVAMPLPSRISPGLYGATRSWSKVPSSRSRAMESAPERMELIRARTAMRPGTMNQRVMRLGLNQERASISTGEAPPFLAVRSAPKPEAICWA